LSNGFAKVVATARALLLRDSVTLTLGGVVTTKSCSDTQSHSHAPREIIDSGVPIHVLMNSLNTAMNNRLADMNPRAVQQPMHAQYAQTQQYPQQTPTYPMYGRGQEQYLMMCSLTGKKGQPDLNPLIWCDRSIQD